MHTVCGLRKTVSEQKLAMYTYDQLDQGVEGINPFLNAFRERFDCLQMAGMEFSCSE